MELDKVYFKSSTKMDEVDSDSVSLIVTSPPYFNIINYAKESPNLNDDLGNINNYEDFINGLLQVWRECFRVLKPNGKLCINVPLMPMFKKAMNTLTIIATFLICKAIYSTAFKQYRFIFIRCLYLESQLSRTHEKFNVWQLPLS